MLDLREPRNLSLLIEAAKKGDRIGSLFEGKPEFREHDPETLRLAMRNANGTDESDLLTCWQDYQKRVGDKIDAVEWADFYADRHGVARYGLAMPDFFRLVKWTRGLPPKGRYSIFARISMDRNSYGNLCLQMVAPLVSVALRTGADPYRLVSEYTMMTHAHQLAQDACRDLCRIFVEGPTSINPSFPANSSTGYWDALHTLGAAWWCAHLADEDRVIKEALFISGDADSVLALSLLLWRWMNDELA